MLSGPQDSLDLSQIRRALVIKLRHHGDVLLTSPVFSVLKARAPHMEIDALVYADTREMLSLHPSIAEIHCIDRKWKSLGWPARIGNEWQVFHQLRSRKYDLLIHLSEHSRGAWLARFLQCRFSVAPAYRSKPSFWKKSFSHRYALPLNARRHVVDLNLDALRRIGVWPERAESRLFLKSGPDAEALVTQKLEAHGIQPGGYVHLHPTSRWQFKSWPPEKFAQLIDALTARGERVVVSAAPSPEERQFVEAVIARTAHHPVNLSGQLSLKGVAALAAMARLFVGVDSAPMHIAAAMGTPVIALFGPSGESEWGPWLVSSRIVSSDIHPCRPCGIDGCGGSKVSDCLVTLPVEKVLQAIDDLETSLTRAS
jgi:heptosyltransferase-3